MSTRSAPDPFGDLPEAYAAVLRGLAAGEPDAVLAERAGVEPAALPAFVRIAVAKLLDLRAGGPPRPENA